MNFTLNPDKIIDVPMKDSLDRRHLIWRYTNELFELLCAEGAEELWKQWFHPCSGLDYPPTPITGITPNENRPAPRSRDFYFSSWVIPTAKAEYGHDISRRLEAVYMYIKTNWHFNNSETCRVWDSVDEICNIQDELYVIMKEMVERMYAPRIIFTKIRPSFMTFEEKMRFVFSIGYVLLIIKIMVC